MDELVAILDAQGKPTGKTAMKSEAHRFGWFHPTVHIWCYTSDGHVLLQQRAKNKKTFPLLWDVSVAGHIAADEDIALAAQREIEEEIGLKIVPEELEKVGIFKSIHKHHEKLIDCEFHHTFLCALEVPLHHLQKQESEVADLKLVPLATLERTHAQPHFVPHKKSYYKSIIAALKKKL
ncbi:NUDIX hydrolase [Spongiimicrobium salis]|uniref:NUDIX hydrolase n=1 Tax=Spongiimicrobium salis TaxID=1667022 RepID=UPI00374CB64C